jgi:hypothetical protein
VFQTCRLSDLHPITADCRNTRAGQLKGSPNQFHARIWFEVRACSSSGLVMGWFYQETGFALDWPDATGRGKVSSPGRSAHSSRDQETPPLPVRAQASARWVHHQSPLRQTAIEAAMKRLRSNQMEK